METKFTVSFDIYNTESVKRLQEEDPDILPSYSVDAAQDLAYNKKQISAAITAGIIQGKSIDHIADDLQSRIETMNRASAIRTARTAITNAQNAGTLASMKRLAALGVEVQKEWMATLDSRTRESHRNLDGERRELDERFSNGLMYPGASGSAKEVYNCRCTMVSYLPKYDSEDEPRVTYSEWTEYKKATGSVSEKISGEEYLIAKQWADTSRNIITGKYYKSPTAYEEYVYNKAKGVIEIKEYDENGLLVTMYANISDETIKYKYEEGNGYQREKQGSLIQKYLKKFGINVASGESLAECKSFSDLKKFLDKNYHASIDKSVKKLDFEAVKAGIEGIDGVLKEFPQAASVFNGVSTAPSGLMSTTYNGTVCYNPLYYSDKNSVISEISDLKLSGECPKNETIQSVAAHETGHMLEIALIRKKQQSDPNYNPVSSWNDCKEAQAVILEACNNIRMSTEGINPNTGKLYTDDELKRQVSGYALTDDSECMAECVDEYYGNGDSASALSREVWKVLKSKLG